jgi:hypothetical protein
MQANGKWKERQIERNQIGEKLVSSATMWLKKAGYNPDDYTEDIILYNSLDNLPDDVKDRFVFSDCYVELPLTEENIENLKADIIETVNEINDKIVEYNKTQDEELFWIDVTEKDEYFLNVLSGYSRKLHKPYNEYLEQKEMFRTDKGNENEEDKELLDFLADL